MKARPKALLAIIPIVAALNLAAVQAYRPSSAVQTAGVVLASYSAETSEGQLLPASEAALATRALLETVIPPYRDEADLARRFKQACGTPVAPSTPTIRAEQEGESRPFWVLDEPTRTFLQVQATLKYATPHLLMYVQDGVPVTREALAASARVFETKTYPTLREHFGDLPYEPQITIFNGKIRSLAGYFSSSDLLSKEVNSFSNERPMVFMGIDSVRPGTFTYDSTLAHEVQHLLHHFIHPQQDSWINEGASVLAMSLFGDDQRARAEAYLNRPETQLNAWSEIIHQTAPHYGGGYLILEYFAQQVGGYGEIKRLISSPGASVRTFDDYFAAQGSEIRFDRLFRDFVVANVVNDRSLADGRFGYERVQSKARIQESLSTFPAHVSAKIRPYATRYTELLPGATPGTLELQFHGVPEAKLYASTPPSGQMQWWGNAVDNAESTLTRAFDLSDVTGATLRFNTWFDTERSYDYAGVAVSTDDGCTWQTLPGQYTTDESPTGQNPGHAYTGRSGSGDTPTWVEESMDLTPYVGRKVLVRFFSITDQSFHLPGFAVDNVSIPEIGFSDDAESDLGWETRGFLRSANAAAIDWAVQVIAFGDSGTEVHRLPITPSASGEAHATISVPHFGAAVERVVVAVAPLVPVTLEPSEYRLEATIRS